MQLRRIFQCSATTFAFAFACSDEVPDGAGVRGDGGHSGEEPSVGGTPGSTGGAPTGGASAGGTSTLGTGGELRFASGGAESNGGGMAGGAGIEPLFVPESVVVSRLDSAVGGLEVIASTLKEGPNGPEFYAALRKTGEGSACDASFTIEFYDKTEQSMGAWLGAVYGRQLYWGAETGVVIACVDPGELAMVALVDEPPTIDIDEVAFITYRLSYFDKGVIPFEITLLKSPTVADVQSIPSDAGMSFSGVLENGLDATIRDPSVAIFVVTEGGRPLGMVNASENIDIPAGDRWDFETNRLDEVGADVVAFPYGSIVQ